MTDMRQNALPILEAAGVDLVLTGHSHAYERSFLLHGLYGISSTLTAAMEVDPGDGRPDGDGAYRKPTAGWDRKAGAVYNVTGCSGQTDPVSHHPVMVTSLQVLGSLVLDVNGHRLDGRFLDRYGAIRDSFAIVKDPGTPTLL